MRSLQGGSRKRDGWVKEYQLSYYTSMQLSYRDFVPNLPLDETTLVRLGALWMVRRYQDA